MRKLVQIVLILLIVISILPINANAVTIADLEENLQKYLDELAQQNSNINKTEAEIAEAERQISGIQQEMKNLTEEVTRLYKEIAEYTKEIQEKSLQTKEIFQYFQMSQGENAYMEYIFGSENITDLIYRVAIVEQMTEYNNKITKELEALIEANNEREKQIEKRNEELVVTKAKLDKKIDELQFSKSDYVSLASKAQDQIDSMRKNISSYKEVGCKTNDVIGVDCAQGGAISFKRPISWGYITSEFGYRGSSFHRGLDMTNWDPYSTKVYPVANGKIVDIYEDGNGALIVVITHYDILNKKYYTSLYGHLDSYAPNIYKGMNITSDQYIGIMGNTGYSTGPHLHFELTPCQLYGDWQCYNLDAFFAYGASQGKLGYKGPRHLINFPSTYNYWYSR